MKQPIYSQRQNSCPVQNCLYMLLHVICAPVGNGAVLRGPWGMLRAKIFCPRQKLFVWLVFKGVLLLRTILSFPAACERGGNLSPARTRELQLSFGKLKFHSRLSENSCRLPPLKHWGAEARDHQAVGDQDGGLPVPEGPGHLHASQAPGGNWSGWRYNPLLKSVICMNLMYKN